MWGFFKLGMDTSFINYLFPLYYHLLDPSFFLHYYTYSNVSSPAFLLESFLVGITLIGGQLLLNGRKPIGQKKTLVLPFVLFLISSILTPVIFLVFQYFPIWLHLLMFTVPWILFYRSVIKLIHLCFAPTEYKFVEIVFRVLVYLLFFLWLTNWGQPLVKFSKSIVFSLGTFSINLYTVGSGIFWSFMVWFLILGVGRYVETKVERTQFIEENYKLALSKFLNFVLILIGISTVLPIFGINLSGLTILGSAFAAGLGFGLRNILNNYISGYIILLDKSIRIRDLITVGNFTGYVTKITSRFVVLESFSGVQALIPNEKIISDVVKNETTALLYRVRQEFSLKVVHEACLSRAQRIIHEVILTQLKDFKCEIEGEESIKSIITGIDPLGIDIKTIYWIIGTTKPVAEIHSEVLKAIKIHFRDANIQLARACIVWNQ
ncbi:MAG: mechanosensitive ion channel domain-containing protein [Neisseriaceae bacterium]